MVFTAKVSGDNASSPIKYSWTVSTGTITSGQGTSSIVVQTTLEQAGSNVTAVVEVEPCDLMDAGIATATGGIEPIGCIVSADDYEILRWRDETERLYSFFISLNEEPNLTAYVEMFIGGRETIASTKIHILKILNLARARDKTFDPGRFTFAIENREKPGRLTRFWMLPPKTGFPKCNNNCTLINGRDLMLK